MLRVSEITALAASHGKSTMPAAAAVAPPPGSGPLARLAHPRLTSAQDKRVYTRTNAYIIASGQRPAASGQRPAASGQRPELRPAPSQRAPSGPLGKLPATA